MKQTSIIMNTSSEKKLKLGLSHLLKNNHIKVDSKLIFTIFI